MITYMETSLKREMQELKKKWFIFVGQINIQKKYVSSEIVIKIKHLLYQSLTKRSKQTGLNNEDLHFSLSGSILTQAAKFDGAAALRGRSPDSVALLSSGLLPHLHGPVYSLPHFLDPFLDGGKGGDRGKRCLFL